MEKITGYLILALCFFLLFIGLVFLPEKIKKPVHDSLTKRIPLLVKVNRDTALKAFAAAGFMLFSRKLIYFMPIDGVIQTKFSIWWVDGNAKNLLVISMVVLFVIGVALQMLKGEGDERGCGIALICIVVIAALGFTVMSFVSAGYLKSLFPFPITDRHLILIILAPLVLLKVLVFGKYAGLLTGFLFGYLIVAGYEKLTPGMRKPRVKILIVAALMFLIILGLHFYQSLGNKGNWGQLLNNKVWSVTSETDMMDLLDAVNSINQEQARYDTLERILALIVQEQEFRWKKEIYQQVIDVFLTYFGQRRISLLRKIALWIAKTGDIPWAIAVAKNISFRETRNNVLKEIRENIKIK